MPAWSFRVVLSVSAAVVGLFVGTIAGGTWFVPLGSGLAGPAIAIGYGVGVAVILALASGVGSGFLSVRSLRVVTAIATAAAAVVLAVGAAGYRRSIEALHDPPAAYAGLPQFRVSVERIVVRDPVLSPKVEIDTGRRTWAVTLPDRRVCEGNLRAATQARIDQVLMTLARPWLPCPSRLSLRRG